MSGGGCWYCCSCCCWTNVVVVAGLYSVEEPKRIEAMKNDIVLQVACGIWHSLAVILVAPLYGDSGYVLWLWLLLVLFVLFSSILLMPSLLMPSCYCRSMPCGQYFSLTMFSVRPPLRLCSASWICTWGTGTKGQLGLGSGGKDLMGNPTGPVMFTTRPMIIEEFRQDITVRVCWCRPVNVGVLL